MNSAAPRAGRWPYLILALLLLALDLWSKSAVFAWMDPNLSPEGISFDDHGHRRYTVFGEWFAFMLSRNPGVAFGQLQDFPHLIVGGRILAVLFLTFLIVRGAESKLLALALALILAGALGNLHDNLFMEPSDPERSYGPVRDFIDVYFTRWDAHFPTFNVADSCISVGAVLLLLSNFFGAADPEAQVTA